MKKVKKFIVTNNCYWYKKTKNNRAPHFVEVCDLETGEMKHIENGTVIVIVKGKAVDAT